MMQNSLMADTTRTPVRISYFKRYKMEVELYSLSIPYVPAEFTFVPFSHELIGVHAEVLFDSFLGQVDATVFSSLGDRTGCHTLMTEIARKPGFLPEATWLLAGPDGYCGSIQGLRERAGLGAIQNLGVLPEWRGRRLGTALLLMALHGFARAGLHRAMLEVTAQNETAIRLYRRLGFRRCKTIYKAVPAGHTEPSYDDASL
jgi:ribosomal protein S18 acetylase RimI-like enzyme